MTQEEKLLLKDLCARLPYGVKVTCFQNGILTPYLIDFRDNTIHTTSDFNDTYIKIQLEDCKLYLRPMSSMTEEEIKELSTKYVFNIFGNRITAHYHSDGYWDDIIELDSEGWKDLFDWFNEHHFDYHGLIPMGLALPAHEDMYNIK